MKFAEEEGEKDWGSKRSGCYFGAEVFGCVGFEGEAGMNYGGGQALGNYRKCLVNFLRLSVGCSAGDVTLRYGERDWQASSRLGDCAGSRESTGERRRGCWQ